MIVRYYRLAPPWLPARTPENPSSTSYRCFFPCWSFQRRRSLQLKEPTGAVSNEICCYEMGDPSLICSFAKPLQLTDFQGTTDRSERCHRLGWALAGPSVITLDTVRKSSVRKIRFRPENPRYVVLYGCLGYSEEVCSVCGVIVCGVIITSPPLGWRLHEQCARD